MNYLQAMETGVHGGNKFCANVQISSFTYAHIHHPSPSLKSITLPLCQPEDHVYVLQRCACLVFNINGHMQHLAFGSWFLSQCSISQFNSLHLALGCKQV